jgi:hypothetical protein
MRWLPLLLVLLLITGGSWLYFHRARPVQLATLVPESSICYIEVNDWAQLVTDLARSDAWRKLSPAYGLPSDLKLLAPAARFIAMSGLGSNEQNLLSRAQMALVVGALEVRGSEVKPRLALIAETHGSARALSQIIAQRLPKLAESLFGQASREESVYSGVQVIGYRGGRAEQQIFCAQIGSELILANHTEPLYACIDTRQGRMTSLAGNESLQRARSLVRGGRGAFMFVSSSGVGRLLQFTAHLISRGALDSTSMASTLEAMISDTSAHAFDGVAYSLDFEAGKAIDRYMVMVKPDLAGRLQKGIKPVDTGTQGPEALRLVPSDAQEVTCVNVAEPAASLQNIEAAFSAEIGVGPSILLHALLKNARESVFGVKSLSTPDGITGVSFEHEGGHRLWLVQIRDRARAAQLSEELLGQRDTSIRREDYRGVEVSISSDSRRGASAVIGDFVALGPRELLTRLIDSAQRGDSLTSSPQFQSASRPDPAGAVLTFSSVNEESAGMMETIARWSKTSARPQGVVQLPLAASTTSFDGDGIRIESRSAFGNLPLVLSMVDGK